jgi:hypothetical protein
MSSDVLVLGAMVVTVVATTWWSLTPVSTNAEEMNSLADDVLDEAA